MNQSIKACVLAAVCGVLFPAATAAQSYQLVTSAEQLESGKQYLIVAQQNTDTYYVWNGLDVSQEKGQATTISKPVDNIITPTAAVVPVVLEQDGDYWKIIDTASSNKYVGYEQSSNHLVGSDSPSSDNIEWTISFYEGTTSVYYNNNGYHYLKFNYNSGITPLFRPYGLSENTDIALYKETAFTLFDTGDNTAAITVAEGHSCNVTLQNRVLYRDGAWNTLTLPFNLTISGSVLDGADVRKLESASFSEGKLTLNFSAQGVVTKLMAGTPYIIRWTSGGNLENPTFTGVTIDQTMSNTICDLGDGRRITFVGNYSPVTLDAGDKSCLYLGAENKLYWPSVERPINAFRAYFQLDGITAGNPAAAIRAFVINLGDEETTGISLTSDTARLGEETADTWYAIDGRRLSSKPTAKGLFIHNHRTVVIK